MNHYNCLAIDQTTSATQRSHPPCLVIMNHTHILVRTTDCGVRLTYELRLFLHISERPVIVKAFTYVSVDLCRSVQTLLLSPWVPCLPVSGDFPCSVCYTVSTLRCTCILGISQLDYYYLCRLLTGYSKLKDFWSNDLPPLSEGFLNGPLLWVLWWMARNQDVCTTLSGHSNVYRWLQTAHNWGLAIFVSCKQLCKQCSATIVSVVYLCLHYYYNAIWMSLVTGLFFLVLLLNQCWLFIIIIIIIIIGSSSNSCSSSQQHQQQ
jgi:hypothetical protein